MVPGRGKPAPPPELVAVHPRVQPPMFTYVSCRCGRTLRAQRSSERATIRCWDCGEEVRVRPFRGISENPIVRVRRALDLSQFEALAGIVLLALATVPALLIPQTRGLVGLALIAGTTLIYLRRIEAPGREAEAALGGPERTRSWKRRLGAAVLRGLLALGVAAGMILPFWLADGSHQMVESDPPLPAPWMLPTALAIWVVVPLLAYLAVARDGYGRLGVRGGLAALVRRPWLSIAALLLFPVSVVVMEALIVGGLSANNRYLKCFVADVFPLPPGTYVHYDSIMVTPVKMYVPSSAIGSYLDGLSRGATMVGSIPLSLARGLEAKILPRAYGVGSREFYLLARLGLAGTIMVVLYCVMTLQSRLLGTISEAAPEPSEQEPAEAEVPESEPAAVG